MFLQTDHSGMNKFSGPNDENFLFVGPEIERMVKEAPLRAEERHRCTAYLLYNPTLVLQGSSDFCKVNAVDPGQIQEKESRRDDEARLLEALASDYKGDKDLISERIPGTCEWLFGDDRFLEWRDSDGSRLLWLTTGPGCGKSVLAKALIDERMVCTKTKASTICYFFFKDGQEQRTRAANALSALIHQLFQNTNLITHALDSHKNHGKELRNRFSELWEILVRSAEDPQAGEIICVLDALDECEEKARNQLIDKLFQFFSRKGLYQNPQIRLKFLLTSRPYADLELKFRKLSGVTTYIRFDGDDKSQQIGQEINLVIDAKVPYITGGFDDSAREQICNRLKEMQNRTYLWLFLTIDIIERSPSNYSRTSDIHSLLSDLPSEVSDAYERILSRSKDMAKARILLEIIVAATRPLSLQEANMALAIATQKHSCGFQKDLDLWPAESFSSTVRNFCGLFVNVHNGKISLIHQTAREFLLRTTKPTRSNSPKWEGSLDEATAHGTMSQVCLDYLNFKDRASIDQRWLDQNGSRATPGYHLMNYAAGIAQRCPDQNGSSTIPRDYLMHYVAGNWATHYNSQPVELTKAKDTMRDAMSLCRTSESQVRWFLHYCKLRSEDPEGWTALGTAFLLGLAHVAEELLNEGADINAQNGKAGSALQIASRDGSDQIVRMLLDRGVDVNVQSRWHGRALLEASSMGHFQRVQLLLDKGADINAQGISYGALQAASQREHSYMIRGLLDAGADVNAHGWRGSALLEASAGGHIQTVQILLDKGANVNAKGGLHGSALQAASTRGHVQIVKMLLDKGADINSQSVWFYGDTQLEKSEGGPLRIVQMLLDKGDDVNAQGGLYSALQVASHVGHSEIVQILLDKGADVDAQSTLGSALTMASGRGHVQIVQMLLDKGADVDKGPVVGFLGGVSSGNALQEASGRGHIRIVEMLLDKGADVDAQSIIGSALIRASGRGDVQIVQMLLDKGADVNAQGVGYYGNALQAASEEGHGQVVRLLLEKGADVNAQGKRGGALQVAFSRGHARIVQLLLDNGATDVDGKALETAATQIRVHHFCILPP